MGLQPYMMPTKLPETSQENFKLLSSQISDLKLLIPDEYPTQLKDTLNTALSDISTAYYNQSVAYSSIKDYYNDNDLANFSAYKENLNLANSFMLIGAAEIYYVKSKVNELRKKK